MKAARLLTTEPISSKLMAASAELDEKIRTEGDVLMTADRQDAIRHFVRLYQISPEASRSCLKVYNLRPDHLHKNLGHDVHDRLIELGIIDMPAGWVPPQERKR